MRRSRRREEADAAPTVGLTTLLAILALAVLGAAPAPQFVAVRHPQGSVHGFPALRTLDGTTVADGDSTQTVDGDRVTSRTTFQYRDGTD